MMNSTSMISRWSVWRARPGGDVEPVTDPPEDDVETKADEQDASSGEEEKV